MSPFFHPRLFVWMVQKKISGSPIRAFKSSRTSSPRSLLSFVTSGAQTELSKIVNGKGDWMFYGHSNAAQTGLDAWWPIDLRAFRAALIRNRVNGYNVVMGDPRNPDGTWFKWFDMPSFPAEPPLVVAGSNRYCQRRRFVDERTQFANRHTQSCKEKCSLKR